MQLPAVRSLTLESAQWVSDADLSFLCGLMPHLTELNISDAPLITAIPDVGAPLEHLRIIRVKLLENDATLEQLGMRFRHLSVCELLRASEWTAEAVEALRGLPVTFLLDPNSKCVWLRRNAFLAKLHHEWREVTGSTIGGGVTALANNATPAEIAAAWASDPNSTTECCRALSVLCCRLQNPPLELAANAGLIPRLVGVIKEGTNSDAASFALCAVRGLFACGNSDSRVLSHLKWFGALDEIVRRAPPEHCDQTAAGESLWALSHITDAEDGLTSPDTLLAPPDTLLAATRWLACPDPEICLPALRIATNFCQRSHDSLDAVLKSGAVEHIPMLLNHEDWRIRKEVLWMMNTVAEAHRSDQIKWLYSSNLLANLLPRLADSVIHVRHECATVFMNLLKTADYEQVNVLLQIGFLKPYAELLREPDAKTNVQLYRLEEDLAEVIIRGLTFLLQVGWSGAAVEEQTEEEGPRNSFWALLVAEGVPQKVERFQYSWSETARPEAEKFFSVADWFSAD